MDYKNLCKLFNRSKYNTVRFVCKACETTVFLDEHVYCPDCDTQLEWCAVKQENGSLIVRV